MDVNTFRVLPGGKTFQTSDMDVTVGDTSGAYGKAHLHAAQQAANLKAASWVVRDDTGDMRYGFGPDAIYVPTTHLYRITQMGLNSCFDYAATAWVPLEEEEDAILIGASTSQTERA